MPFLIGALALTLATSGAGASSAEEPAGEGKSYFIPALEVPGFILALNVFNRLVIDPDVYGTINRGNLGFTVRVFGPHAIGVQYLVSTRDAGVPGQRDRQQSLQTVSLSYNFLGHTRFGAVEWRSDDATGR